MHAIGSVSSDKLFNRPSRPWNKT